MIDLDQLVQEALTSFSSCNDANDLENKKAQYLGKAGALTELLKTLGKLPVDLKKSEGARINQAKLAIEAALIQQRAVLADMAMQRRLSAESLDVTLPGRVGSQGGLHPVTRTLNRIENLFRSIGFDVADGPEIEDDFHNFTALNTPENHPARSMHDTFYLLDSDDKVAPGVLLRTHTSPIQARYMEKHVAHYGHMEKMPEIRLIAPGRVYRVDSDATHSPMFHQVEGLWVGTQISFADLKGVVSDFLCKFFESNELTVRFRPSFFPFTEPSAEIDVAFRSGPLKGRWLEIAGCGMVHPNVLTNVGIDPSKYTGFAFGFGPDRLTMLRYGVNDLRMFFEGDVRFLRQFH